MRSPALPCYDFSDKRRLVVGTMYCIGRNYREHAAEMGASTETTASPLVFLKPPNAYAPSGSEIEFPSISSNLHHEVELVVVIGQDVDEIREQDALAVVAGVGVGIDFTLRDLQQRAKELGEPWAVSKGFRHSAPISSIVQLEELSTSLGETTISLAVNGVERQTGRVGEMERSVASLIHYLSAVFGLRAGDCIFTGTPKGVGPVVRGDKISARLNGVEKLQVSIF